MTAGPDEHEEEDGSEVEDGRELNEDPEAEAVVVDDELAGNEHGEVDRAHEVEHELKELSEGRGEKGGENRTSGTVGEAEKGKERIWMM